MSKRKRIKIGILVASSNQKTFQTLKNCTINVYYTENCFCNKIIKTTEKEKIQV